jgi:hypothetical protein
MRSNPLLVDAQPTPAQMRPLGSRVFRLLGSGLIAVVLAAGLLLAGPIKGSVAHPVDAAAASYCWYPGQSQLENRSYSYRQFWDVYRGGWNYLNVEIDTYCYLGSYGYEREYHSMQWTSYATDWVPNTAVRTWVCGGYVGTWARWGWDVWSPWLFYSGCARQADNVGSWTYLPYNGSYVSQYVSAG